MSYSQLNQDKLALVYFKNKCGGYFVDIGANDGKEFSNTLLMEEKYNWKGICVEPLPIEFKKCKELRKNSICKNVAIYDQKGEAEFNVIEGEYNMYSGIREDINHHMNITEQNGTIHKIPTMTFTELLDECDAPSHIDFLSLDTEGSELKILQSLNHDKYKFTYLTIEHNYREPQRTKIRELLLSKGYEYIGQNQWDDVYILKQKHDLTEEYF